MCANNVIFVQKLALPRWDKISAAIRKTVFAYVLIINNKMISRKGVFYLVVR